MLSRFDNVLVLLSAVLPSPKVSNHGLASKLRERFAKPLGSPEPLRNTKCSNVFEAGWVEAGKDGPPECTVRPKVSENISSDRRSDGQKARAAPSSTLDLL